MKRKQADWWDEHIVVISTSGDKKLENKINKKLKDKVIKDLTIKPKQEIQMSAEKTKTPLTPMKYLIENLNDNNDFLKEYKSLDNKDKDELKEYAKEEIDAKAEAA